MCVLHHFFTLSNLCIIYYHISGSRHSPPLPVPTTFIYLTGQLRRFGCTSKVYPLRPTSLRERRHRVPFARHVVSAWCLLLSYNIASAHLLRKSDLWPVDLLTFSKRTLQGQFRGPPTYSHHVWRRSVKGPPRSRGTNKQTDKHCSKRCLLV